jgi:hypothetical protein
MVTTVEVKEQALEEQITAEWSTELHEQPVTAARKATCVHYWLIERAEKPTSEGQCKKCNEVRTFKNSIESEWAAGRSRRKSYDRAA